MNEDLLHFIWKYQKFSTKNLITVNREKVTVLKQGTHNQDLSGPDFLNAQLIIGEQRWAGTVEIHIKSSDWYAHRHQEDANYTNVILHVVWEHDVEVFNSHNQILPTLILSEYIPQKILETYQLLHKKEKEYIPCAQYLSRIDDFTWSNWLERIFFERLETKATVTEKLLKETGNDWEAVCFALLAKSFGGNINGDDFLRVALSIPIAIFQKETDPFILEAIFMGQAGLLDEDYENLYYNKLQLEFKYATHKHQLQKPLGVQMNFFKLRPPNFPTLRISQLTNLYAKDSKLFQKLVKSPSVAHINIALACKANEFWDTHYNFQKESPKRLPKTLTKSFVNLLILNTVLPLRFVFEKHHGIFDEEKFLAIYLDMEAEKNKYINQFKKIGKTAQNAIESQAIIQLKKHYCNKIRCLDCNIGCKIISM